MNPPMPPEPLPGARLLFSLDPALAYLDNGALGAVPIPVQRAQQRLREEMEANPARFFRRGLRDRIAHTRRHLATAVGADPERTALVANTSTGISVVLHSLKLGSGDEVVTTDHGYAMVDLAVDRAVAQAGARHTVVPVALTATDNEIVAAIRAHVDGRRTRLAIVDMIAAPTARLFPVARIAAALREAGVPLLVDGAHAPGALPVRIGEIGADFFVGTLHKWAYAPRSTALLSVAPQWTSTIRPLVVSRGEPDGFPGGVEFGGTLDYTGWLAAPTGLFVLRGLGADRVRAHNAALAAHAQRVVGDALGIAPEDLPDPGGPVPMRVVPVPAAPSLDGDRLCRRISDELGAEVAVNGWHGGLLLRLSAQVYNEPEEYARLAAGLPALLKA